MASLKLKLVIDKKRNRVLFAEAGKDFVDFIFHILSLPVGTLTRSILSDTTSENIGSSMPGCFGSIYEGVKDLDGRCIDSTNRDCLLKSKAPFRGWTSLGLLPEASLPGVRELYLRCCSRKPEEVYVLPHGKTPYNDINYNDINCSSCRSSHFLSTKVSLCGGPTDLVAVKGGDGGGYVNVQPYMVTDDLRVKSMSAVSVLSLMGPTENLSNFENREVDFGRVEALKLLKACLQSKTVLTDVFLNDVAAIEKGMTKTQLC